MKITGTFLDEISHDIPHQNWGEKEWEKDFQSMKLAGIDTVILIRCGHKRFITYPSEVLIKKRNCYNPPLDLVELFLRLSDKYGMKFFFGLYDNGCTSKAWEAGALMEELDDAKGVAEEVWRKYGHHKSFQGWYLNHEISAGKKSSQALEEMVKYNQLLGGFVKDLSGNLPTMISPYIAGVKQVGADKAVTLTEHEKNWDNILSALKGKVDILAFQDGHCDYEELLDFMQINKSIADHYGMTSWTNCESFDRDMPIKFLPIKWEKMRLKLEAAEQVGVDKAITFEFSHFMSPNSMYQSAHGLFDRYMEYIQEK